MTRHDASPSDGPGDLDAALVAAFERTAIPRESWTHEAHVRLARALILAGGADRAIERLRAGLPRLVRSFGVEETPESGYHETVTIAWVRIVATTMAVHGAGETFEAFAAANPHLLVKSLLREHYSRARILMPEARARFVAPDLAPLPVPGDPAA